MRLRLEPTNTSIPKVGKKTPVCRYRSPSDRGRNVHESALDEEAQRGVADAQSLMRIGEGS